MMRWAASARLAQIQMFSGRLPCASVASRYGPVRVTSVRQTSSSRVKVYGYAQRGYRTDNWDCTVRSDGRITDFDI